LGPGSERLTFQRGRPCASGASADASSEILNLVDELEQRHPNPYHAVSRDDFRRAADDLASRAPTLTRDQQIVGVMRLLAKLGERDGHSGIHPLSPIPGQRLTAYPLRLYLFPEGLFVAQAEDQALIGARVTSIGGVPAEQVEERVRPLITRGQRLDRPRPDSQLRGLRRGAARSRDRAGVHVRARGRQKA